MYDATAPCKLTMEVERTSTTTLVKLHGKLVSGEGASLYTCVSRLIPDSKRIVLDLGDVTQMDSLGLGTLVRLYVSCKAAGSSLELMHLGKRIRELLALTNLLSVFTIIGERGGMIRM